MTQQIEKISDQLVSWPHYQKCLKQIIYNQLGKYIDIFLNKMLYRLLKSPLCLVRTMLMDLSKAYDCLPYDLIIAKFEAYGLNKYSLSLLLHYLISHK